MSSIPSMTKTWHDDTYPSIDSHLRPELRLKNKRVVITGGGAGIGRAFGDAFADAGAASIAILGRREHMLQDVKEATASKHPSVNITVHATDVTDIESVRNAAHETGSWDVLVSNAGYMATVEPLTRADPQDWWTAFDVNVKGLFNVAHAFLPTRNVEATLIGINTRTLQLEHMSVGFSAYSSSKIAALKVLQTLADENPDLHVVAMHPGVIDSEMTKKVQEDTNTTYHKFDRPQLPGHFAVWLCSEEARFLRGKFVWANWMLTS